MAGGQKDVVQVLSVTGSCTVTGLLSQGELAGLLRSDIIKGNLRMPNDAAIAKLSRSLHGLEGLSKTVSDENGIVRLAAKLLPAIDVIVSVTPTLVAQWKGEPEFDEDVKLLTALTDAANAILKQRPTPIALAQSEFRSIDRWGTILGVVVDLLMEAIGSTNPGVLLSHYGPVAARFAVAVIPAITGETPTLDAVAQRLKRNARSEREIRDISGPPMSRDKTSA